MAAIGLGGTLLYHNNDQFRHVISAVQRCSISGYVGARVALDYKLTLSRTYASESEAEEAKRACHLRCANRVLRGLQTLGGVYVKLGQHVSAMVYLLPIEWTSTMAVLQDRCDPSSEDEIRQLFLSDYGQPIEDVFEEFDWKPIGVASLAQVHKARLRSTADETYDGWVAVKLEHPSLDEFCQIDMKTVTFIFDIIKRAFPDFGFDWFADEMRESLPKELDFVHEAQNARQVEANFAEEIKARKIALVIPKVIWAKRRIMCMEFIEGSRIDDLEYMKRHGINPQEVSSELIHAFSEMIFLHGFVHCDPHPGNVIIRHRNEGGRFNFDLVLLDHGLYRTLPQQLRADYAQLWTALIKGDEKGIEKYSLRVGGTEVYQIFACMLTGREWDTIQSMDLNSMRTSDELGRMSMGAMELLKEIADILGKLPRAVLLLLKTNDLLRHVDETLSVVPDQRNTYLIMGRYCAQAVWLDTKQYLLNQIRTVGLNWRLTKHLFQAWWNYEALEFGLWFYRILTSWKHMFQSITHS
ncbi:ABC1 family-domain-containing protein [Radiomyces spectabilis]|uniref:ABC1 family-domain-containing protein n=1 Tax=Radiomyces spectabilis TaxID=64574 RepID=UPI002220825A|nr:ABC1 family-domain-containing protein [Radiomyces spectabilis]KAI8391313.1 ABC1 family-domain-containing protein [Radiomyces spectabilis]